MKQLQESSELGSDSSRVAHGVAAPLKRACNELLFRNVYIRLVYESTRRLRAVAPIAIAITAAFLVAQSEPEGAVGLFILQPTSFSILKAVKL